MDMMNGSKMAIFMYGISMIQYYGHDINVRIRALQHIHVLFPIVPSNGIEHAFGNDIRVTSIRPQVNSSKCKTFNKKYCVNVKQFLIQRRKILNFTFDYSGVSNNTTKNNYLILTHVLSKPSCLHLQECAAGKGSRT